MNRALIRHCLLVCLLLPLALDTSDQPLNAQPPSPREIRIGGLFDLTGGGAIWGKTEKNAFLLACSDFQTKNPDITIKPLIEDSMFSSKQTVTALHKLSSVDKAPFIVGATWETTVAMMPICESKKIICISPSYHGKEYYERPWRYNFTAWFDDRGYSQALVKQMNARGYKKVAIFAAITPYYDSLLENFEAHTQASVASKQRMVLEERDFKSMITRVPKDISAILMLLDNAGQIQAFLKQWSELRHDRPDVYSDDLIVYLDPPENVMRYGFTFYYSYPLFEQGVAEEFTKRYTATYKHAPEGSSGSVAYDETMLLLECAAQTDSVEATRDCISKTTSYTGYSGTFSFKGGQTVRDREIGIKKYTGD